ncbi:MAG: protein kinase domain-containing protein, partial [Gemmataceae bacterium]
MKVLLRVIAGPHSGKEFVFDRHDSFLVGRSKDAHLRLSIDDPYFSRRHFLLEINPPRCRILDVKSRNGIAVNNQTVQVADLVHDDEITAGHTTFRIQIIHDDPDHIETLSSGLDRPSTLIPQTGTETFQPQPSTIPGYELQEELGRGAMGVVYRAIRVADQLPVAIKMILPAQGSTRKQLDRFLREAAILRELDHRHVVRFYDVGESNEGLLFLVMELVEGPNAAQVLREKGPLELKGAVRIATQFLMGLGHAHERGFVHRDVKPGNLLIGRDGSKRITKLADFGLARVYESSNLSGLTLQGELGGTPAFMAPEQVTHYRDVRPAAD